MASSRIAVVGGGIVGASVAFHLGARTSDPIVVYERGELASATTSKATAMIGVGGPDPYHRMKEYGFRLYNEFFADPAANPEYRHAGRLRLASTTDGARRLEDMATGTGRGNHEGSSGPRMPSSFANSLVHFVPGEQVESRFILPPVTTERIEGALYRPQYGYIQDDSRTLGPRELAFEFVERARDDGVDFETGTEVSDIVTNDGTVTGIELDGTTHVDVDTVVCAAGPWNGELASLAGLDLPIEHFYSPVFSLELDEPLPYSLPMLKCHEAAVGIHPKRNDRVLVTYTPDVEAVDPSRSMDDISELDDWREHALRSAEHLLPRLEDATLTDEWVGLGTDTPDGQPIVGWTDIEGLALAVTMSGIQYAPAVGSIVARQLVDGDPTRFYDAVTISRFDGYDDSHPARHID